MSSQPEHQGDEEQCQCSSIIQSAGPLGYVCEDCGKAWDLDDWTRRSEQVEPAREELTMIALALKNQGIEGVTPERGVEILIERLYAERQPPAPVLSEGGASREQRGLIDLAMEEFERRAKGERVTTTSRQGWLDGLEVLRSLAPDAPALSDEERERLNEIADELDRPMDWTSPTWF